MSLRTTHMENGMRINIYAIKTDGLRYYITDCPDEDDTVEATLSQLAKGQAHKDTVRFELVPLVES